MRAKLDALDVGPLIGRLNPSCMLISVVQCAAAQA
jgi:hypothetical protein